MMKLIFIRKEEKSVNRSKREDYKRLWYLSKSLIVIAQAAIFCLCMQAIFTVTWSWSHSGERVIRNDPDRMRWSIWCLPSFYGGLKVVAIWSVHDVFCRWRWQRFNNTLWRIFRSHYQQMVYVGLHPDRNDRSPDYVTVSTVDLGLQVYLLRLVMSQKVAGDLRRPWSGDVIHKMNNSEKDKYDISGKVHIRARVKRRSTPWWKIAKAWLFHSIPDPFKYSKYCFSFHPWVIRSPKISDIILLGTDRIHLFDTLLDVQESGTFQGVCSQESSGDYCFGLGILHLSSPIMLIIAIGGKAMTAVRYFISVIVLPIREREFRIRKFRSMCGFREERGALQCPSTIPVSQSVGHVPGLHLGWASQLFNAYKMVSVRSTSGTRCDQQEYEYRNPGIPLSS